MLMPALEISLRLCSLSCLGPCLPLSCLLLGMTFMVNRDAISKSSYKTLSFPEDHHLTKEQKEHGRVHPFIDCFQK